MRNFPKSIFVLVVFLLIIVACAPAARLATVVPTTPPITPTVPAPTSPPTVTATTAAAFVTTYAITGVTVLDVEKGVAIPDQTVIVVGDRIDRIETQGKTALPAGAETINGKGLYLMPGLVDAHVHYFETPTFGRLMIANGVLLVRDMGMPNDYILKLREELNLGKTLGPEMVATGAILDGDPPAIPTISIGVSTPGQAQEVVQKQAQAGVDMIKVYSKLDKEVFLAIVDQAQKLGLKIVGHVPDSIYLEDAAMAGQESIEHWFGFEKVIGKLLGEEVNLTFSGFGADSAYLLRLDEVDPQALQDFYQRLQKSGVTVDPTVVTFKNWPNVDSLDAKNLPRGEYLSPNLLSLWKSQWSGQSDYPDLFWKNWVQMVKGMNQAGIPLMVGTDLSCPGVLPGFAVHEEMAIWQEAGIPAADVLRSATLEPAKFMGLGERLGSISVGKEASMVLVRGNPFEDIRNAQMVEGVFLRGKYFDRQALDGMLAEARDLAKQPPP